MRLTSLDDYRARLTAFERFLTVNGCTIEPLSHEWTILRARNSKGEVGFIYFDKHGHTTLTQWVAEAWAIFIRPTTGNRHKGEWRKRAVAPPYEPGQAKPAALPPLKTRPPRSRRSVQPRMPPRPQNDALWNDETLSIIDRLLARDGLCCWLCGTLLGDDITIEHLVPKLYGGPNHISNYVLAHSECNHYLGSLHVAEKIKEREKWVKF